MIFKPMTKQQMKDTEETYCRDCDVSSLELMEAAANALFTQFQKEFDPPLFVSVLCGDGNNAGDGYGLARLLLDAGYYVTCIAEGGVPKTEAAAEMYRRYTEAGGVFVSDADDFYFSLHESTVIVDAICGIGYDSRRSLSAFYRQLIRDANNMKYACRVAIDIPTGVNCDDGTVSDVVFRADRTYTITQPKIGLLTYPGREYTGEMTIIDIGIDEAHLFRQIPLCVVPDDEYVGFCVKPYEVQAHKGTNGRLLCIVGSEDMTGAAVLSLSMALRSGVGLVTLAAGEPVARTVKNVLPEVIYRPFDIEDPTDVELLCCELDSYDAVLIGCGLGQSEKKANALLQLLREAPCRVIIDADGINLLSSHIDVLEEAKLTPILTPHPGEFSRLSGLSVEDIVCDRLNAARGFTKSHRCVLALKGAGTIVSDERGTFSLIQSGTAGLAKGGSGDVLAGLVAGLAAQPGINAFDAATVGCYLHGKGAEETEKKFGRRGMLPHDLIAEIGRLLP